MGIFSKQQPSQNTECTEEAKTLVADLRKKITEVEEKRRVDAVDQDITIKRLEAKHAIELQQKEFDIKTYKDVEIQKIAKEKTELEKKLAVAEGKNEMLQKMVDFEGSLVDVKSLITNLMAKLPEFKISSLTVNSEAAQTKK